MTAMMLQWLRELVIVALAEMPTADAPVVVESPWVYKIPGKAVACGQGAVLSPDDERPHRLRRWDAEGRWHAIKVEGLVVDLASYGDTAWVLTRNSSTLSLIEVECSSGMPVVENPVAVPGLQAENNRVYGLLLLKDGPWISSSSHSGTTLLAHSTGAVHESDGEYIHATPASERVVAFKRVRGKATVRNLKRPTEFIDALAGPRRISDTEGCFDVVSNFGQHAASQDPQVYVPTPDGALWSFELRDEAGQGSAGDWVLDICVVPGLPGDQSARHWQALFDVGAGKIQFVPIDQQFGWLIHLNSYGGFSGLFLLDSVAGRVQKDDFFPESPDGFGGQLVEGGPGEVFLVGSEIFRLTPDKRIPIDNLPEDFDRSRLLRLWHTNEHILALSTFGELREWTTTGDDDQRSTRTPCGVGGQPMLITPQPEYNWGRCNDQHAFGITHWIDPKRARSVQVKLYTYPSIGYDDPIFDSAEPTPSRLSCGTVDALNLHVRDSSVTPTTTGYSIVDENVGIFNDDATRIDVEDGVTTRFRCVSGPGHILYWFYTDQYGNEVTGQIGPFELVGESWARAEFFTPIVVSVWLLLAGLWLMFRLLPGWVRGVGFLVIEVLGMFLPLFIYIRSPVFPYDARLGCTLHLMGLGLLLGTSLLTPRLFWQAASAPPFDRAARALLRLGWIRRRQFAPVVKATKKAARDHLIGEFGSTYCPLPVRVTERNAVQDVPDPVEVLHARVAADTRGAALIEGESGTGKTFLLRQILLATCDAFLEGKSRRVPLLLAQPRRPATDPFGRPRSALAQIAVEKLIGHGYPPDVAAALMQGTLQPEDTRQRRSVINPRLQRSPARCRG